MKLLLLLALCCAVPSGETVSKAIRDNCEPDLVGAPRYEGDRELRYVAAMFRPNWPNLTDADELSTSLGLYFGSEPVHPSFIHTCFAMGIRLGEFGRRMKDALAPLFGGFSNGRYVFADGSPWNATMEIKCGRGRSSLNITLLSDRGRESYVCLRRGGRLDCDGNDPERERQFRHVVLGLHDEVKRYVVQECSRDLNVLAVRHQEETVVPERIKPFHERRPGRVNTGMHYVFDARPIRCTFYRLVPMYREPVTGDAVCRMTGAGVLMGDDMVITRNGRRVRPVMSGTIDNFFGTVQQIWAVVDAKNAKNMVCRCVSRRTEKTISLALPDVDQTYSEAVFEAEYEDEDKGNDDGGLLRAAILFSSSGTLLTAILVAMLLFLTVFRKCCRRRTGLYRALCAGALWDAARWRDGGAHRTEKKRPCHDDGYRLLVEDDCRLLA